MISIAQLFGDAKKENGNIVSEGRKHYKYLSDASIPTMSPPKTGTKDFEEDIESVLFYMNNPCLSTGFLNLSHNSVEDIFKEFSKESGLRFNWKTVSSVLKDVNLCIKRLKNEYKRPRPKFFLQNMSAPFNSIKDMDSYSFPSGHTAVAYFISGILSQEAPEHKSEFENIARLVGQSRIENGVHFPTDVTYGRLLGEYLSDLFLGGAKSKTPALTKKRDKKHDLKFANYLKRKNPIGKTIKDIATFLNVTCSIEGEETSFSECLHAAKRLLTGIPDNYLSKNPNIMAQCAALRESYFLRNYSPSFMVRLHNVFPAEILDINVIPGEFRSAHHFSPTGVKYSDPENFNHCLRKLYNCNDPALRHYLFEWIHPFADGNGRVGRILLAFDLNYDFEKVNNFIMNNYIQNMDNFYQTHDVGEYFY